jgi:hypothetical protein
MFMTLLIQMKSAMSMMTVMHLVADMTMITVTSMMFVMSLEPVVYKTLVIYMESLIFLRRDLATKASDISEVPGGDGRRLDCMYSILVNIREGLVC